METDKHLIFSMTGRRLKNQSVFYGSKRKGSNIQKCGSEKHFAPQKPQHKAFLEAVIQAEKLIKQEIISKSKLESLYNKLKNMLKTHTMEKKSLSCYAIGS